MGNDLDIKAIAIEEAVFRLDRKGRWRNRQGSFERKKIVYYFRRRIERDDDGYSF